MATEDILPRPESLWIWKNDRMIKKTITFVPVLYRLFDEILLAVVNKRQNPMTSVKVRIDVANNLISVWNNGKDAHMPESIFDKTVTSNDYDEWDTAKLVNVYLTEFVIETADGEHQSNLYKQVFTNNTQGNKTEITKCNRDDNWTMVSFKPDLEKIGIKYLEDDTIALLKRRVVDLAGCLGKRVKVELDGTRVPPKMFEDYVELYTPTSKRIYQKINNRWEVCVCLSDGHFEQVSFVNNIATMKGGSHVDYITNQITGHLEDIMEFEPNRIKSHLWVFVNAIIDNPAFDSQTKEKLTTDKDSFGSTCELTPWFLDGISTLGVVSRLLSSTKFYQNEKLVKTDGKRKAKLNIPELEDAKLAATANSGDCTLILTQNDAVKFLAMGVRRDYYGVYPLTGKLVNVREASLDKNAEFENISKILGLRHGEIYENVEKLRYGHLMIMADQDHDGSRITGLLINFLHFYWPSLLKVPNFLRTFITPIVKASNKKTRKVFRFYSTPEYEAWKDRLGNKANEYKITYYKGMRGGITREEVKEWFADTDRNIKDFFWADDEDGDAIELAFSKKKIEERKDWILAFELGTSLDLKERCIRYRDFIHLDYKQYLVADLQRSIPSMVDGLKSDQRTILFYALKEPTMIQNLDVGQFSDYVSGRSDYYHGEASQLVGTIAGMAENYVGSINNINLLQPRGNGTFGSRYRGGKDHAKGRNLFLSPITRYLFLEDELLEYLTDGGVSMEPAWFIPIIPMVLVNGSEGIGTAGWSSFIPNYNPRDIICNLKRLLNGEAMVPMLPWYKGFDGNIQKTASEDTKYTTTGIYKVIKVENALSITELPVRRWIQDYAEFLEAASQDGKDKTPFIKAYKVHYFDETAHFEVFMTQDQMNTAEREGFLNKFKLTTTLSTDNMHLFDANGVLKKYDTPEQILKEFIDIRLKLYENRRTAQLRELEKSLSLLENKLRFTRLVNRGEICVIDREPDELYAELKCNGFEPSGEDRRTEYDYLLSVQTVLMSDKRRQELKQELDAKKKEFDLLTKTPPKSLWLRDLAALEHQLKKQDKRDAGMDSDEE